MTTTRTPLIAGLTTAGLATAGLATAALALTLALPATSSTADPSAPTQLVLKISEKDSEQTFVDERRRGESVGDRYYSAATLRSGGEVAGRLQTDCAVLDNAYSGHLCHLVLVLDGGQLTLAGGGVHRKIPNVARTGDVFAVTGGTGDYQDAAGEMVAEEDGRTLTVTLTRS